MPHHVRELTERREREFLSPFAACALDSAGRARPEESDPIRTAYQRDRDRILHSKSFRRLKHKTQVFIDPFGDHYRTRLTHTLEVAQIARTIGRALRLNEDLIEAIALGHDVGHSPFGHAGERALDEAVREHGGAGFRHYEQSLRIVDVLDRLNLTEETRLGIDGHSKGRKDLSDADGTPISTLEAAVVRISDRVAYLNSDLDDAVRSGIIKEIPPQFASMGGSHGQRIGMMVEDIVQTSFEQPHIRMSPDLLSCANELKEWMFENVYLRYPILFPDILKAEALVGDLFRHFAKSGNLPEGYEGLQGAIDYVAGMTDRFAIETFTRLRVPSTWRVS